MVDNTLRIQIDSGEREASADAYLHALQATIDVLKEVNKESSRYGSESIEWQITDAGKNSPLSTWIAGRNLPSTGNGVVPGEVIDTFVTGLTYLESHNTCPPRFNAKALKIVAKYVNTFSRGVQGIEFSSTTGSRASVSHALARNADHAVKLLELRDAKLGKDYKEYGSIEGWMSDLSSTLRKRSDSVTIIDDLTQERVRCHFNNADIEQQVRNYWKHRVVVTGELTILRENRRATDVKVEEITPLRDRSELPQIEDLRGINITNGIESARYIDELRDAE